MDGAIKPRIVGPDEGEAICPYGLDMSILLRTEDTDGAFSALMCAHRPGEGPPAHFHTHQDEYLFVVEGTYEMTIDGRRSLAGPETIVYLPAGTTHAFTNVGDTVARHLDWTLPGGQDHYFREIDAIGAGDAGFDDAMMQRAQAVNARFDTHFPSAASAGSAAAVSQRSSKQQTVEAADEIAPFGTPTRVMLTSDDTGGAFSALLVLHSPGEGPPPHSHARQSEYFYVVEGEYVMTLGDETRVIGPGTIAFAPPGTVHTFRNISGQRAKMLDWSLPGGQDRYFREISEMGHGGQGFGDAMLQRLAEVNRRYDVTFFEA